ncbi:hypothetical protein ABE237_20930 [Brevibacillus formosus]|uniref:hypothetical protein n=1 Tax=Brevibacillus formosus TaxID=54913 RepID=UPI0018CF9837|nr:hypothetical protein [Brevibacillus formosus]MBG9943182.1 hypothetical protein [Brevibacillus formosus]MBW5471368.1 hypothetical protein [Brevibacillus formosus]
MKRSVIFITIGVLVLALFAPVVNKEILEFLQTAYPGFEPGEYGQMGDWFGGSTAPFLNFFSTILLLFTFIEASKQSEEAQKQGAESTKQSQAATGQLKLALEQIELQKSEIKAQSLENDKNRFESQFFQMVSMHQDITKEASHTNGFGTTTTGRKAFQTYYDLLKH